MSGCENLPPDFPHPALALGYKHPKKFESLEDRIENAMRIMANIVADDGEAYLLIFESLEEDLRQTRSKSDALDRALALSQTGRIEP